MRLYRSQVPRIAHEIIQTLSESGDIELERSLAPEAEKDLAAIMEEYLRMEMKVLNEAKDLLSGRQESREGLGRLRRELSERYNHPTGDEGLRWLERQLVEGLMASRHIEEVYGDDLLLQRKIKEIFKKVMVSEEQLDEEVRGRLKNLQEGTPAWEIQYQKTLKEVRRKHGLS